MSKKNSEKTTKPAAMEHDPMENLEKVDLSEEDAKTLAVINGQIVAARQQLGEIREVFLRQERQIIAAIEQKSGELNSMAQNLATKNNLDQTGSKWTLSLKDNAFIRQKSVH